MTLPAALIPKAWSLVLVASEPVSLGLFPEARWAAWCRRLLQEHTDDARPALWWFGCQRRADPHLRAGEACALTLYALPAAEPTVQRLLTRLQALPDAGPDLGPAVPLGRNVRLLDARPLTDMPMREALALEAAALTGLIDVRLCLRSPARWLLAAHRTRDGEGRFVHHEREVDSARLSELLRETLLSLRRELDIERIEPPPLDAQLMAAELFWTQLSYRNADGRDKPCGGVLGELILRWPDGLPAELAPWLALLQHLGCGQRRGFGYGQFALEGLDGSVLRHEHTLPGTTLAQLATPEHLLAAYERASEDTEPPFDDRPESLLAGRDAWIERAVARWQSGPVEPRPLQPARIPKPAGGERVLAIPPFLDRVLQRVLLDHLAPALDAQMAPHSYGFRPGRSRQQARDRVLALYEQGYRVVVESDVADFFDSVDFWRVAVRLRAFLGVDPLVDQVMAFISAPLDDHGSPVPRTCGLPQGAPLSPLLSNLILDDLDHDLADAGYAMVRYADDFVILARSADEARAALNLAQQSLAEKGLRLKGEKSRITSFDEGFSFLGYRFAPGLAVDRRHDTPLIPDAALVEELADLPIESSDALTLPASTLPPADAYGTLVFLTESDLTIGVSGGQLIARRKDGPEQRWPLAPLAALVLLGRQRLTSGALQALLAAGVPVHVADNRGHWLGATTPWPQPDDIDLWIAQRQRCADPAFALDCARATIAARIRHQREALRRRLSGSAPAIRELDAALQRAERSDSLDALRGHEGTAARTYFGALREFVPAEFGFEGRDKRPPRDPYNALLSLGAVILHTHVDLILRARGLLPTVGFMHQPHGRHATLASDLMEPVRHRVERLALSLLRRGQLPAADFEREASGAVRLRISAKRRYIEALQREFATASTLYGADAATTLHEQLWQQATGFALACRGKGTFTPIRYR